MTENGFFTRALAGVAGIVLAASLAAAPAFAGGDEKDKGGSGRSEEAHESAPGQHKKAEDAPGNPEPGNGNDKPPAHAGGPAAQSPPPGHSKPAKPARPAKPQHASKPAKPARPAAPARPVNAAAKPANPHAKAGKTTICHATGSATNPYVTITISDNALPAHARHQDGRDLIPAPAGGCPQAVAGAGARGGADHRPDPAGREQAAATPAAAPTAAVKLLGRFGSSDQAPAGQVLGVVAEGGAAPQTLPRLRETIAEAPSAARRESGAPVARAAVATAGQLPFTGLEAALVALLGALLILLGVLFRQLGKGPARIA